MGYTVDPEVIVKSAKKLLEEQLPTVLKEVEQEWAEAQDLGKWVVPADALDLPAPLPNDISIGRLDTILAESNFPAIWIWIQSETAIPGDQDAWYFSADNLYIRVLVQGVTPEHALKLAYRYADAVRKTILRDGNLLNSVVSVEPPSIDYVFEEEHGLYVAAQLQFQVHSARVGK